MTAARIPPPEDAAAPRRSGSFVAVAVEPLSPELALVSGELRAAAIASLPERPWRSFAAPPARITPIATAATRPLAVELALYALWQLLVGAMLGFGAVAAVGVAMLVVGTVV